MPTQTPITPFAQRLLNWHAQHGRHDLPWQKNPTPYRVWVSEIMLQQTQVTTVIPYYERFMDSFPTLMALANADLETVLSHWSGLGYYARARNLHKAAQILQNTQQGKFPDTVEACIQLPGIGRSTAGAILSFAKGKPTPILDGNVKRVLTRHEAIPGWPEQTSLLKDLWHLAEKNTPEQNTGIYNQAIMDLGATICTRQSPECTRCPLQNTCQGLKTGRPTDFPHRKPKAKRRKKEVNLLVIHTQDESILLVQRPPVGIWGGLFCFPESAGPDNIETTIDNYLSKPIIKKIDPLPPLPHAFTHFELTLTPYRIHLANTPAVKKTQHRTIWCKIDELTAVGIPAPVQKIINRDILRSDL